MQVSPRILLLCLGLLGCSELIGGFPAEAELRERHCQGPDLLSGAAPDDGEGVLVFAQRLLEFVHDVPVGIDLDNGVGCAPPAWGAPVANTDGIDNAFSDASLRVGQRLGGNPNAILSYGPESGDGTGILRVSGYNGQPHDPEIEVDVFDGSMGDRTPGDHEPPRWDGTDVWNVRAGYAQPDGDCWAPKIHTRGEVSYGTIIIPLLPQGYVVRDMIWRATLVRQEDGWHLKDGLLAGKWRIADLLHDIGSVGEAYCTSSPAYPVLREEYCRSVDMDSDADGTCDAISLGALFQGFPVKLGDIRNFPPVGCPPALDPGTYGCDRDPPQE